MKNLLNSFIRNITIITLLLIYNTVFGQYQHFYDYFDPENIDNTEILDNNNYDFVANNTEPVVFNVYFYGLVLTDTSISGWDGGSLRITEERALEKIANLNIDFNPYNIFFKYRGFELYGEVVSGGPYNGHELARTDGQGVPHSYMFERIDDISSDKNSICIVLHDPTTCSQKFGNANISKKIILSKYCQFHETYITHQMGHLLGLLNTQTGTQPSGNSSDPAVDTVPQIPLCDDPNIFYPHPYEGGGYMFLPKFETSSTEFFPENVTRDETNTYYNANVDGDRVKDTPAAFWGSRDNRCHIAPYTYEFQSQNNIYDNSPEQLKYINVDILNYMTFGNYQIRNHFTAGQGVRMRETIEISSLNFDDIETTVESLFEPYKVIFDENCDTNGELDSYYSEIPDEDPRNITLNSGLTYRAADNPIPRGCFVSYFQPGFDYEVYWCRPINPQGDWEMGDLIYTYNKDSFIIPMFNIGAKIIRIVQLDMFGDCNHPYVIAINAVNGSIYTHGNTTYEAEPLDSIQINNPDLFFNLPSGIHTIKVQTNENEIIEKTIIKQ